MSDTSAKMSAVQMAMQLGDRLPRVDDLPPGGTVLAQAARDLVAAIVATDIADSERLEMADTLKALTTRLREAVRDPLIVLARTEHGAMENLTQAGWGRWNPQSLPIRFEPVPFRPPDAGGTPRSVEIRGRCTLAESHSGPPSRAHGGVVMTLLDEALGVAAIAAGAGGVTAGLNVRLKAATPLGVELELRGRYERSEGRKNFISGEILADGVITAQAEGIYIAPPLAGSSS